MAADARTVVWQLERLQSDSELTTIRKRLAPGEAAIGIRMGDLFATAKAHTDLDLTEVDRLLDEPAYEPRMAAMCILDFKARRHLDEAERSELADLYLGRHDRITTWDMVDRAAPRVLGGHLVGRSMAPLFDLAASLEPLRRRSAVTAPLYFVITGDNEGVTVGFELAARVARDPEPVVHNAVGIFLKHAGSRDRAALHRFLETHAAAMPRPALRLATEKLDQVERARYRT
jgi:3-methyladenine DNA glycosylase AlkD